MSSKRALFEQWQKAQPPPQDPASPQSGKPHMFREVLIEPENVLRSTPLQQQ